MSERIDHDHEEAKRHGITRSPHWPQVEREHLRRQPLCVACTWRVSIQKQRPLQVHHIVPFHYAIALGRPDLELDQRNLITLCETEKDNPAENHHLLIGHVGNFRHGNLTVEHDAISTFFGMRHDNIVADPIYALKVAMKLKPLDEMNEFDKHCFKDFMDLVYPIIPKSKAA